MFIKLDQSAFAGKKQRLTARWEGLRGEGEKRIVLFLNLRRYSRIAASRQINTDKSSFWLSLSDRLPPRSP